MNRTLQLVKQEIIFQDVESGKWGIKCPSCNCDRFFTERWIGTREYEKQSVCPSCSKTGTNNPMFGKHITYVKWTPELRKQQAEKVRGRKQTEERKRNTSVIMKEVMHRPDIRKRHIEALHQSQWLKVRTDKGQLELLDKWNRLGFKFEPNYQVHTDKDLFYVDGYDKEHNVVMEYDSKYHNKTHQKQKDLERQQMIINLLKPKKFWRYNSVNKTFTETTNNNISC